MGLSERNRHRLKKTGDGAIHSREKSNFCELDEKG